MRVVNRYTAPLDIGSGFLRPGATGDLSPEMVPRVQVWIDLGWLTPVDDAPSPKSRRKARPKAGAGGDDAPSDTAALDDGDEVLG